MSAGLKFYAHAEVLIDPLLYCDEKERPTDKHTIRFTQLRVMDAQWRYKNRLANTLYSSYLARKYRHARMNKDTKSNSKWKYLGKEQTLEERQMRRFRKTVFFYEIKWGGRVVLLMITVSYTSLSRKDFISRTKLIPLATLLFKPDLRRLRGRMF